MLNQSFTLYLTHIYICIILDKSGYVKSSPVSTIYPTTAANCWRYSLWKCSCSLLRFSSAITPSLCRPVLSSDITLHWYCCRLRYTVCVTSCRWCVGERVCRWCWQGQLWFYGYVCVCINAFTGCREPLCVYDVHLLTFAHVYL